MAELDVLQSSVVDESESLFRGRVEESDDSWGRLREKAAEARRLTTELRGVAVGLCRVPLAGPLRAALETLPSVSNSGTPIRVEIQGEDTEFDQDAIEQFIEPLSTFLRGLAAHAFESPSIRAAQGKPVEGTLRVAADRLGSEVVIRVSHDGFALDLEAIARRGARLGLLPPGSAPNPSTLLLMFDRGVSTPQLDGEVKGGAPQMEAIKSMVECLSGSVTVDACQLGTCFGFHLPAHAMLTDGLWIESGHQDFVIPLRSIAWLVDPAETPTVPLGDGWLASVQDEWIPVLRLDPTARVTSPRPTGVLVVINGTRRFALSVDALVAQQVVVTRSMGALPRAPYIAGGSILGDGRVGLVLNLDGFTMELMGRSRSWLSLVTDLAASAGAYLRTPASTCTTSEEASSNELASTISLVSAAKQIELKVSLELPASGAEELAGRLFGEADPELTREMLSELANIFMGTVRRSFSTEGVLFTGGLPETGRPADASACWGDYPFEQHGSIAVASTHIQVHLGMRSRLKQRVAAEALAEGMVVVRDLLDDAGQSIATAGTRLSATMAQRARGRHAAGAIEVLVA